MTKEEYERLLKSDYWRGYSYSLIKERNFTCEDCGRRFYNERNKLQVHHLVYRDTNPWSYKPEELVVLCEECHQIRHGIWQESEQEQESSATNSQEPFGDFSQSYSHSTDSRGYSEADRWGNSRYSSKDPYFIEPENRFKFKYVIWGLLLFVALVFGYNKMVKKTTSAEEEQEEQISETLPSSSYAEEEATEEDLYDKPIPLPSVPERQESPSEPNRTESPSDILRPPSRETHGNGHVNAPRTPQKPTRELSSLELIEKRNHEEIVQQAKRAGVSTEGSTMEILERINHAEVVEQAKRAGVSTKGSTMEILERINHAEVVEQAKRAGVSTKGSTMEILERINRKELEKMNW